MGRGLSEARRLLAAPVQGPLTCVLQKKQLLPLSSIWHLGQSWSGTTSLSTPGLALIAALTMCAETERSLLHMAQDPQAVTKG